MNQDIVDAVLLAGIPLLIISFMLFAWGYKTNKIAPEEETPDQVESDPDDLTKKITEEPKTGNFIFDKWFQFGGGYYGVMCMITFLHLELGELIELGTQLYNATGLGSLIQLLIQSAIQLFLESILNLINAFLWWNHWANILPIPAGRGFTWLICSYVGYSVGQFLAVKLFTSRQV